MVSKTSSSGPNDGVVEDEVLEGAKEVEGVSSHEGGVNVALMDGSARFVVDGIDPIAMAYQISVSDGQAAEDSGR